MPVLNAVGRSHVKRRRRCPLPDRLERLGPVQPERRLIELPVLDDAPLRHLRLEEDGLQQPAQCARRRATAREHHVRRHLVQLGDGGRHREARAQLEHRGDHREHQRVGRDAMSRLRVDRHAVAHVLEQRRRLRLAHPLHQRVLLLLRHERGEREPVEGRETGLTDARGPRSGEQHVSLRSEHLGDVPLNLLAVRATLVEPVQQEQRAAHHHRLSQHAV
mmetsp:Transcript_24372/g.72246  ORF Transcript_24372/g.72246 Transcript_24372/m.72246 type:complete len:219 (+) Transcript_24372:83-739(+)